MESITLRQAYDKHPDAFIMVIGRADQDGVEHDAIFVWETEKDSEDDDGSKAIAIYRLLA